MGPPFGNDTFFGLKDPPIGDVTLSGTDFHGFCLVSLGVEIVSWFLIVSGWFPCFLKVVFFMVMFCSVIFHVSFVVLHGF